MAVVEKSEGPSLRAQEKAIAEQFMVGFPWIMLIWPLVNTTMWLALWPLVMNGLMPVWAAFPIALINMTAAYLPSHDAQHHIFFREGSRWHWVNEAIGWYSLIPMAAPLTFMRETHFEHHRQTNNPDLDPDYNMNASSRFEAMARALVKFQKRHDRYGPTLQRLGTPAARQAINHILLYTVLLYSVLTAMAWSGHIWAAVFIFWLPNKIGSIYIGFYLSWAPHQPMIEQGRYRDTHAFRSIWGNIGSSGMQYHIVHHLYPTIPLSRNPAAFRALRPILIERGCDLGGM